MFKEILANELNKRYARIGSSKILGVVGDHITSRVLLNGYYERMLLEGLKNFFHVNNIEDGVMFDVGANIGNHTMYFSKVFKMVVAVEADPEIFEILKINSKINRLDNCKIINIALSDQEGTVAFETANSNNLGTGRVINPGEECANKKIVAAVTGDKLVEDLKIKNIQFVKIDVEGHELSVILGLKKTIQELKPIIAFESNSESAYGSVSQVLKEFGYNKMYALQYPFSSCRKPIRVILRALTNCKSSWKEIGGNSRSTINDLVLAVHDSSLIKIKNSLRI